jgi:hypothetical protein
LGVTAAGQISTYPPSPENRPPTEDLLPAARLALYSGRAERAYRLMLLAQPEEGNSTSWLNLCARVYLALDRPMRMADCLASLGASDPRALKMAQAVMQRLGPSPPSSVLTVKPASIPPLDRSVARRVVGIEPAPDGSVYILTENALIRIDRTGQQRSLTPLAKGRDITLDEERKVVALGESQILWGDAVVPIPAGLDKPVSVAASPEGSLILLDRGARRLYRLDPHGKIQGSVALSLRNPAWVRVDMAGRIYIADKSSEAVHVFRADMSPLRDIDPAAEGHPVRRMEGMEVDFAGDVMLLDGRGRRAVLFSGDGRYLSATGEDARVTAMGWDGLDSVVVLDERSGVMGRIAL